MSKQQQTPRAARAAAAVANEKSRVVDQHADVLPFERKNYILLLACIGIIVVGFFLMSGDKFVDSKIFSVQLHIAPIVVVAGFLGIIYAIMYQSKSTETSTADLSETQTESDAD
jgi:undecaprenyl pyrophosphate phosphatase UppP